MAKQLARRSRSLFPNTAASPSDRPQGPAPRRDLRRASERVHQRHLANLKVLRGRSDSLDCRIGREITVNELGPAKRRHGRYMITALRHLCTSDGDYENTFQAVPAGLATPPIHVGPAPQAETQSAVVVAQRPGRPGAGAGAVSLAAGWAHSLAADPFSVQRSRHRAVHDPEKGEEVLVGFAGGNPERPYVLGAAWNGGGPSGFGTEKNDIKAIKTRSGHTIELNDKSDGESITIKDKGGNSIHLDTKNKSITINAPDNMTLNAKNMEMNIQENLTLNVGKSKTEHIKEDHIMEARNKTEKILKQRMVRSGKKTEQQAGEPIIQTSEGDMTLDGTGTVTIQSDDRVDFGD